MNQVIEHKYKSWIGPSILLLMAIGALLSFAGCKKLVETEPPSNVMVGASVFSTDGTAIAVLDNMYINMHLNEHPFQGTKSIALLTGLSADELTLYSGISSGMYYSYYTNALSQALGVALSGAELWAPLYNYIFQCNAAIEGLNKSTSLTPLVKKQLLGEAKFMRAFYYFYMANLFGDVPLILSTDPNINLSLSRSPKKSVYEQIIVDLKDAEELLGDHFLDGALLNNSGERTRPTKWAATALLARVFLYTGDYVSAEDRSSNVINNTLLFGPLSSVPLNSVFQKNSREAIWQLQPTAINFNTQEAQTLVIPQFGPNNDNPVYLSKLLLNSFELGDQRAVYGNWIDITIYQNSNSSLVWDTVAYANKYKLNTFDPTITASSGSDNMQEYFMVLRLGEQYLIRAEARARLNKVNAINDLNELRNRAGLANYSGATDQSSLVAAILHERQVELFCEWGNRWFDLKRTGNIDVVMNVVTPLKSNGITSWLPYQAWYPIPLSEIQLDRNLVQTEGY